MVFSVHSNTQGCRGEGEREGMKQGRYRCDMQQNSILKNKTWVFPATSCGILGSLDLWVSMMHSLYQQNGLASTHFIALL
jgi:hypothetical protein